MRQLLLCDTKGVGGNAGKIPCLHLTRNGSMCSFVMLARLHEGINAGSWRCFKNSSWQVCTQAVKLAPLPWMTYWRTRSFPQNVSAVIIIWDCTVWKLFDPQYFLLVSFCDWIQIFFKLGGENQGVFNYGAIWGWLCCALVVVPVFFLQKCDGEEGLLLITRLWRWRSNLISHFNINAIGSFKISYLNLHKLF